MRDLTSTSAAGSMPLSWTNPPELDSWGTDYSGGALDVIVPSAIVRHLVTAIGGTAFQFGGMMSVSIPEAVTRQASRIGPFSQVRTWP